MKPDLPIIGPIVADLMAQAGLKSILPSDQYAGPAAGGPTVTAGRPELTAQEQAG